VLGCLNNKSGLSAGVDASIHRKVEVGTSLSVKDKVNLDVGLGVGLNGIVGVDAGLGDCINVGSKIESYENRSLCSNT